MILPGSYANGFAPRDGSPLYPELWRGCVGAWAPSLGPTGLTLRDWSGRRNHGNITNGATWQLTEHGYAIDFDGTNDRVVMDNALSLTKNISISAWVKIATASQIHTVVANANTGDTDSTWGLYVLGNFSNRPTFKVNGNWSNIFSGPSIASNVWTHLAVAFTAGTNVTIYINGVPTSWSLAFTPNSTTTQMTIGSESPSANRNQLKGSVNDVIVSEHLFTASEVRRFASEIGIAYQMQRRRRSVVQVAASFNRRRRLLVGAGS